MDIRVTAKQIEILSVIKTANEDGTLCSIYDLMDKIYYEVKRDALLHSIKILADAGYIDRSTREVRDGKSMRLFRVTTKAAEIV